MKFKRVLSALLCALLVSAGASSCASKADTPSDGTTADNGAVTEAEVTEPAEVYNAPTPSDLEGYAFRVSTDINLMSGNVTIIYAEEMNGEAVNDAIFARDRKVEEQYNIDIVFNEVSSDTVKKAVAASDDTADITFPYVSGMFSMAQEGYILDFNTISSIDLTNPWYDQRIKEDYAVNGKVFGMTGDYTLRNPMTEFVIQFNKQILSDYNFSDPYQMVWDGSWTFDKMWEMASQTSNDVNGDGQMDGNDIWGFITEVSAPYYFFIAGGDRTMVKDGDGFRLTLSDEKTVNALTKSLFFAVDGENALCVDDGKFKPLKTSGVWTEAYAMFTANQSLFRSSALGDILEYREMKMDYGILPIPKPDEAQDGYYCLVSCWDDPMVIPITVSDPEITGTIIEGLFYESHFDLKSAFFDTLLSGKLMRDEESVDMLELITKSKTYDIDWSVGITGVFDIMSGIAKSKEDTLVSKLAKAETAAQTKLDKFIGSF